MDNEDFYVPSVPVKKFKVLIGMSPRMQPFDESMDSLLVLIQFTQNAGIDNCVEKIRRGAPGWHHLGVMISHCIKYDCTHLFLAADDMLYPPDTILRLVKADKDVISGIYRKAFVNKVEPANPYNIDKEWMQKYDSMGVYETEFVPGHTMLIKREVLDKMIIDYPELAYINPAFPDETHYGFSLPMIEDKCVYENDWALSLRAKRSGFKLWADFGCRLKHYCGEFLGFDPDE
jgi:hypothetical protein